MMRTSVNLRSADMPRIVYACEKSGLGRSELICLCLRKYFASHPERLKCSLISRLVEYQPDGPEYKIVNVHYDVDSYNLAVNFRVFSRLSVSMMVTIALELYLNQVVSEIGNEAISQHNYVSYDHQMGHNAVKNSLEWDIIWTIERNISPNLENHPHKHTA